MADTATTTDIVVIGNGMFGSAAIRHLSERGQKVTGIGAPAQDQKQTGASRWPEPTVYSSHNDAARLTRRQDRNADWAKVTDRAVGGYREIEERSGVAFFHDVGCLIVSRPGGDGLSPDPTNVMVETGVDYTFYEPGDTEWKQRWPEISLPSTHYVAFESSPAGYIEPKRLIAAQNVLAKRAGATLIEDTVIDVTRHRRRFIVTTATGQRIDAGRVLVAAGAFSNFNGLMPKRVHVTLKSEVIVLGEVTPADAMRLARFPTLKYLIDPGALEAIYMVPPVQYGDGRYYLKLGANTQLDHEMAELAELQSWFSTDTDPDYLPLYEPVMRSLWSDLSFISMRTQPCVITYSDERFPIIDQVDDDLYVAVAGNGGGAKGSDVWGERAADLMS